MVVPKDFAEDDFREHAADVFIGAADEDPEGEDESVRTVTVIVHDVRCHGDGEHLPMNGSSTRIIIMTVMYFICVTSPLVTFAFTTNAEQSAPMRIAAFCAR